MTREVKTLKEAVAPILWLNCIFCMGVFEIPLNHRRFCLSVVYVALVSSGYVFVFYQAIVIFKEKFGREHIIFFFVWAITTVVSVSTVILFWRKSENIHNIIKRNSAADITLEALGIKRQYQKLFYHNIGLVIGWVILMTLLITMHIIWMYRDIEFVQVFYTNVCFSVPIMINCIVDHTFAALIRCVHTKFRNINILLDNILSCTNESDVFKLPDEHDKTCIAIVRARYKNRSDKVLHLVQTLRQLHLEITRITRQINKTYCVQLLLETSVHFTIVTATSYCLYTSVSSMMAVEGEKIVAMCVWGSVYSLKVILMNDMCTRISQEAYKTGEIIQSFESCSLDDDLREEIHQFTQQIVLNSLNITAVGFFTLNNYLTGKFFATVTTYVVILIQMKAPT